MGIVFVLIFKIIFWEITGKPRMRMLAFENTSHECVAESADATQVLRQKCCNSN